MGDSGSFIGAHGLAIAIDDTQKKLSDMFVHEGRIQTGKVALGDAVVFDGGLDFAGEG